MCLIQVIVLNYLHRRALLQGLHRRVHPMGLELIISFLAVRLLTIIFVIFFKRNLIKLREILTDLLLILMLILRGFLRRDIIGLRPIPGVLHRCHVLRVHHR